MPGSVSISVNPVRSYPFQVWKKRDVEFPMVGGNGSRLGKPGLCLSNHWKNRRISNAVGSTGWILRRQRLLSSLFELWRTRCRSGMEERCFMNWGAIRIWAAIILLLDASFGLWNHQRFEKSLPKINIAKIALVEAGVALLLLGINFWMR